MLLQTQDASNYCLSPSREMKMEKRPFSGIARVMPSNHMGPSAHPTSTAGNKIVLIQAISAFPVCRNLLPMA